MFDFHEKRKIKSWIFSKPTIFLLLVASFFLATSVYERYQKERETAQKHAERAAELATLQAHAAELADAVAYMQSARGIEEEIRDRFDATKVGEQAVIVMDEVRATASPSLVGSAKSEGKNTGRRFLSWILFWR